MIPLKYIVETCTSPAAILTLFVLVALWLRARAERSYSLKVCLILSAALHLILLCTPLGEILIGSLEQPYAPLLEPDRHPSIHWIVVLSGNGVDYPGTPVTSNLSEETLCRLVEGVRVYKLVPKARIVVSGGILRKGERAIAEQMADFILSMGIPRQDILTEVESKDTYENLRNTQKLVQHDAFYLVTSAYHLRRALGVSKRLGMQAIPCPAHIQTLQYHPSGLSWLEWIRDMATSVSMPSPARLTQVHRALHEYVGYVWYQYQGRI